MNKKIIILILPSLSSGGMERVMTQLANYFVNKDDIKVFLLIMTKSDHFYELPKNLQIIEPPFDHKNYSRIMFTYKILFFVRSNLKKIRPNYILSFGGKYNAFVLLSSLRLNINVFISDRSCPTISYGKLLDFINPIIYKKAKGIIAQTLIAKGVLYESTKHQNIKVIGNPIRTIKRNDDLIREKIILNVGRFISSKHQELLIEYFLRLNLSEWKLIFLGDGPLFEKLKHDVYLKGHSSTIIFKGNVKDIDYYYNKASVFAFTSLSEGFPNSLGEAMKGGLACISFDCNAGPADLIDDGVNGFLIKPGDHEEYKLKLKKLCTDKNLRQRLGINALKTMEEFELNKIGEKFYEFIFDSNI